MQRARCTDESERKGLVILSRSNETPDGFRRLDRYTLPSMLDAHAAVAEILAGSPDARRWSIVRVELRKSGHGRRCHLLVVWQAPLA